MGEDSDRSSCGSIGPERGYHKLGHHRDHVIRLVAVARDDDSALVANFLTEAATHTGTLIDDGHLAVVALDGRIRHDDAVERTDIDAPYAARAVFL